MHHWDSALSSSWYLHDPISRLTEMDREGRYPVVLQQQQLQTAQSNEHSRHGVQQVVPQVQVRQRRKTRGHWVWERPQLIAGQVKVLQDIISITENVLRLPRV